MFTKKLKLTVVLFLLAAFFVVPTSTIFSARHIDKLCTKLKRTYKDGENKVEGGCSSYGETDCNSKSLEKEAITANCDKPGTGVVCILTPVTDEVTGTIQCKWVPANPNGLPTTGYCSESSTGDPADGLSECSQHEDK